MADVLLIANRKDYYTADRMQGVLASHGLDVDFQDFVTGASVDLGDKISGARTVVFFWSKDADGAAEMRRKIGAVTLALASGNVLVVRLDETELPIGLRDLDAVTTAWGPRPRREDYETLARRIATLAAADRRPDRIGRQPPAVPPVSMQPRPMAGRGAPAASRAALPRFALGLLLGIALATLIVGVLALDITAIQIWPSIRIERHGGGIGFNWLWVLLGLAGIVGLALALVHRLTGSVPDHVRHEEHVPGRGPRLPPRDVADEGPPADVFISYSRKDAQFARELVRALEAAGKKVWIDTRAPSESRYAGPIVRALRSCQTVALLCSKHSFGSDHVLREIYLAGDFKKPLVAVQLDGTAIPDDIIYFLTGFPRIEAAKRKVTEIASEIRTFLQA